MSVKVYRKDKKTLKSLMADHNIKEIFERLHDPKYTVVFTNGRKMILYSKQADVYFPEIAKIILLGSPWPYQNHLLPSI